MSTTRWLWIRIREEWLLAYAYVDPAVGPSAKGAVVSNPPTFDEIRTAVDHPNRTVRDPAQFGAVPIGAADALAMGLPKDPPWIGFFEQDKAVPPPRGEPSRVVIAIVTQDGHPVAGARVQIGEAVGAARELIATHTLTSDTGGRCTFPLAPTTGLVVVATTSGAGSRLTDVVPERDFVEVALEPYGALEGVITRDGAPIAGSISITGRGGGIHQVRRSDASGRYRVDAIVPDTYDVSVQSVDPATKMIAGTPVLSVIDVPPGAVLRQDFDLPSGVRVDVALRIEHDRHHGSVYLIAGEHAPETSVAVHALVRSLARSQYHAANSSTTRDGVMRTSLLDVPPGVYTMCIYPSDHSADREPEQPVIVERVVIGSEPLALAYDLPSARRFPPAPAPAPGPRADVCLPVKTPAKPPPIPPKRK